MYEVEVKVRADLDGVRRRLDELDATRTDAVEQRDTYYDAPHRDFAETDEALRVRRERRVGADEASKQGDETTKVTYKGPLVDDSSKTREEHETVVADDEAMAGILDGLGYEPAAVVEKERTFYALGDATVTLDRVRDLGEFVEVEREATEDEVDDVRESVFETLRSLDLDPDDGIRTSYLGLLLAGDDPDD
ncbi:class IV adenylate cyclase [Halobium salinum]|uniref:Class IV adenylate cyclase n=1 Tax=Halobium salinum TaxID=1364940 RepID=A0ABD5PDX6_9EURY|nr:class IV adenylate cyclase [Halobium salinum]